MIQWTEPRPKKAHINGKGVSRNISGSAFDGPHSSNSGTSPHYSPPKISSPPPDLLSLGNCLPGGIQRLDSTEAGAIDWGKSWAKRKPRRRHDVSENSEPDPPSHRHPLKPPIVKSRSRTGRLEHEEQEGQHQLKGNDRGLKSCPELNRRSFSVVPPTETRFNSNRASGLESPDYSQFHGSRHRGRRRVPDIIARRFRSLLDRLHRGRSSTIYSIRPEFPPPPDGKERRFRSRNSNDIWPSSGEESPVFNTPESNMSPVPYAGHNTDLLAASGLTIATTELDRLTGLITEGSSLRIPTAASRELARISSSASSPRSESESSVTGATHVSPTNSPPSLFLSAGSSSPMSRSPQKLGRKGRKQHSHLSEVTTPEELGTPAQAGNDDRYSTQVLFSTAEVLQETYQDSGDESLIPRPLSISRPSSSDGTPGEGASPASAPATVRPVSAYNYYRGSIVARGLPQDPASSGGPTLEALYDNIVFEDERDGRRYARDGVHSPQLPSTIISQSKLGCRQSLDTESKRINVVSGESKLLTDVMEKLHSIRGEVGSEIARPSSCHPDTWSEDQGEPGDSEPFCPPNCLYSEYCSHNSDP
ncbi:hypothetical protein SAMD00023353_7900430 [Rosellinia necatrix]|uniref:Uncharacterized protein n=1 Tax=Rosellinia necatrix TaxID=77044 RepID=A0A1W2TUV9_ROSNE|nr:hypothetical protein SAMD00023353_7900430 [Rosellinia necatrix]